MAHRASLVLPHQQYALEDIGKKTVELNPLGPWTRGCYPANLLE